MGAGLQFVCQRTTRLNHVLQNRHQGGLLNYQHVCNILQLRRDLPKRAYRKRNWVKLLARCRTGNTIDTMGVKAPLDQTPRKGYSTGGTPMSDRAKKQSK